MAQPEREHFLASLATTLFYPANMGMANVSVGKKRHRLLVKVQN